MTGHLTIAALIGAGLSAGVFFSFLAFTMYGLKCPEPAMGAAAMREINREAPKAPLMSLMFGTALTCAALMVDGFQNLAEVAAGALFLVSVIMLTGMYHVPRKNALDRLDAESQEGQRYREIYRREWSG